MFAVLCYRRFATLAALLCCLLAMVRADGNYHDGLFRTGSVFEEDPANAGELVFPPDYTRPPSSLDDTTSDIHFIDNTHNRIESVPAYIMRRLLLNVNDLLREEDIQRMQDDSQELQRNSFGNSNLTDVLSSRSDEAIQTRFYNRNGARARGSHCAPRPRLISLVNTTTIGASSGVACDGACTTDDKGTIIYHPPCTLVNHCAGCSGSNMLQCLPTAIETLHVKVVKLRYTGSQSTSMTYLDTETVAIKEHTKCSLLCRYDKSSCSPQHEFNDNTCTCQCKNQKMRGVCTRWGLNWVWDDNVCRCVCRYRSTCQPDQIFDQSSCRCKQIDDFQSSSVGHGISPTKTFQPDMSVYKSFDNSQLPTRPGHTARQANRPRDRSTTIVRGRIPLNRGN